MNKKVLIAIMGIIVVGTGTYFVLHWQKPSPPLVIANFEECEAAGYPVGESHPRQCWTPDGRRFVEELDQKISQIITLAGELTLSYKNGQARLEGILQRSTPCVEWEVRIGGTDDLPPSFVEFAIFDKNKGVICIQIIGEPQEIIATSPAAQNASYHVIFEDQTVFSGTLLRDWN